MSTITATHADLTEAVREASLVIGRRGIYVPILAHALVRPCLGTAVVRATNLEVFTERIIGATTDGNEPILLPIHATLAALKGIRGSLTPRKAASEPVTLAHDGETLTVSGFGRTLTLGTLPSSEAPDYPDHPALVATDAPYFIALGADLGAALKFASVAAGADDTLPMLTTVCMDLDGEGSGGVTLAATDRWRLAVCGIDVGTVRGNARALIPGSVVPLVAGLAGKVSVHVTTAGYSTRVTFTHDDGVIDVRALDAQFPAYQSLIPAEGDHWRVDRKRLVDDVTAAKAGRDKGEPVRVTFDANITVQGGSPITAHDTDDDVPERVAAFNPAYLLDGLKAFTDDDVTIQSTSANKPHMLTGRVANVPGVATYLLMPARLPC